MLVPLRNWLLPRRWALWLICVLAAGAVLGDATTQAQGTPKNSQAQTAWLFLRAVLRADYRSAYGRLAPEVRQQVSLAHFQVLARPLWKSGQLRSRDIELYKLGLRLGEQGTSQLFYTFSFATDSVLKMPSVLLETTFRDTTARAVLGFSVRYSNAPIKSLKPPVKAKQPRHTQ